MAGVEQQGWSSRGGEITGLQGGPERASERPIWDDLEAVRGRKRPQALLEVRNHEFAGRLGTGFRTADWGRFGGISGPELPIPLLEVRNHWFAGRLGKGLRTADLMRFGGISGPGNAWRRLRESPEEA